MKPEKQKLLDDLLAAGAGCEATLLAGGRILRRRRQWRAAVRGVAVLLVLVVAVMSFEWRRRAASVHTPVTETVAASPKVTEPQALTDDQLLALFTNTPVALATLSDGRERLIFPRPGDEQKFIHRL